MSTLLSSTIKTEGNGDGKTGTSEGGYLSSFFSLFFKVWDWISSEGDFGWIGQIWHSHFTWTLLSAYLIIYNYSKWV